MSDPRPVNVVYLHGASAFGGASKSLCELLASFPDGTVRATVIAPRGSASQRFTRVGATVVHVLGLSQWDHTRYGYYRGLRWLILMREAFYLLPSVLACRAIGRSGAPVDVVHVNESTLLGLGIYASRVLQAPLVVHVRSVQNSDTRLGRMRWFRSLLRRHAAAVVAIDETVRASLSPDQPVRVIHNGLRRPADTHRAASSSRRFRVGIVGLLLRLKGVFEFLEAARICTSRQLDIDYVIVGENARELRGLRGKLIERFGFGEDVRSALEHDIRVKGLTGRVSLPGFVDDVGSVYRELDVLCFPSHLDAAGRPVFEAAWYRVPSIVAVRAPMADTIVHEVTGLAIPDPDPVAIAAAIERLYRDRELRLRLGQGARAMAEERFDMHMNAARMLDVYRDARQLHGKAHPA